MSTVTRAIQLASAAEMEAQLGAIPEVGEMLVENFLPYVREHAEKLVEDKWEVRRIASYAFGRMSVLQREQMTVADYIRLRPHSHLIFDALCKPIT